MLSQAKVGPGVFDHDNGSRQAIFEIASGASFTNSDAVVTLADNTVVRLAPKQIAAVLAVSHARVQSHRKSATRLRAEIDAARTAELVSAISWPSDAQIGTI